MNRKPFAPLCLALVMGLVVANLPSIARAQPFSGFHSAGWKQGVDTYWPGRAVSRNIDNARGYAQDFHNYVAKMPTPEPSVVKEVKLELARYLEEAKKHLATMRKDFAADKETVAAIESIEKDLASAIGLHKEMIECCENEKFDKIAGMTCCSDLLKQLDKIHAAHQDLMRKLSRKYAAPTATK